jgi:hypothetical protein
VEELTVYCRERRIGRIAELVGGLLTD